MRTVALLCCSLLIVGCRGEAYENGEADMPDAATIDLAAVAGTWDVEAMGADSDSVLVAYQITATDNTEGWMIHFEGRDPIPQTITVDGDSVMASAGPFESMLREGVMVSVASVTWFDGDTMRGTFVATYETDAEDSVLNGRASGTRAQD